jgi:hypothetical protein
LRIKFSTSWAASGAILLVTVLTSCSLINKVRPTKQLEEAHRQKLQQLEFTVSRTADDYVGLTVEAINGLQREMQSPEERLALQDWKVQQATAAYTIATGPNPVDDALDMAVLASLSRTVVDKTWTARRYEAAGQALQNTYQAVEAEAWKTLTDVLSERQLTRLRGIISSWQDAHPHVRAVSQLRFRDFAQSLGTPEPGEQQPSGNLSSLVGLDPFSLDPATQEITRARELAQRSMYYLQRMPTLLDMQTERLTYQLAVMPESRALLSDSARFSQLGPAATQLTQTLPGLIASEREATIKQLMGALDQQSATVTSMARELRLTLQAGTEAANALRGATQSLQPLAAQWSSSKAGSTGANAARPPFDPRQYTALLEAATSSARELNGLTQRTDALLPVLRSATREASERVDQILNHLFVLLLLLIVAATVCVLLAVLTYRYVVSRNPAYRLPASSRKG